MPVAAAVVLALFAAGCQSTRGDLVLGSNPCAAAVGPDGEAPICSSEVLASDPIATAAPPPTPQTTAPAGAPAATAAERPRLTLPPFMRETQTPVVPASTVPASVAPDPIATGSLGPRGKQTSGGRSFSRLADAVASAVMQYPEIAINKARVREAAAGIGIANSALLPSADLRLAAGSNYSGSFEGRPLPYATASNGVDARFDGGVVLRQLIYDFGAARSDIERAKFQRDAESMKLIEKIDDVAHRTAQSFLRIQEQRTLLGLIDETIAAHQKLLSVVQAHAKEGHGTVADVQRVNSRLVDVRAIRSDVSLQLMAAEDQFERFTRGKPGKLDGVPNLEPIIPSGPAAAISRMLSNNPRLAALSASRQSTQKELEGHRASQLPKFNLEIDTESKNFRNGQIGRTQLEGRALFAMRYRFLDGGLSRATDEQIRARLDGHEVTFLNEREQFEADIRQAYRAIDSSKRKTRLIGDGVASARRVRELYLEQFKGGKRTIFELLDGHMSYFTARRSQIEGQFEGRRAIFDILKATGELTLRLSRS